jgi:hypothetical protein
VVANVYGRGAAELAYRPAIRAPSKNSGDYIIAFAL